MYCYGKKWILVEAVSGVGTKYQNPFSDISSNLACVCDDSIDVAQAFGLAPHHRLLLVAAPHLETLQAPARRAPPQTLLPQTPLPLRSHNHLVFPRHVQTHPRRRRQSQSQQPRHQLPPRRSQEAPPRLAIRVRPQQRPERDAALLLRGGLRRLRHLLRFPGGHGHRFQWGALRQRGSELVFGRERGEEFEEGEREGWREWREGEFGRWVWGEWLFWSEWEWIGVWERTGLSRGCWVWIWGWVWWGRRWSQIVVLGWPTWR